MGQISTRDDHNESSDSLSPSPSSFLGLLPRTGLPPPHQQSVDHLGAWQGELVRQTRTMQRVANITYEEFLANIKQLNEISSHYLDSNGKQLVFAVKKGSDSTILWKATVRIACVKVDTSTKEIDSYRSLSLKQFLQIFNRLKNQSDAVGEALGADDADCHRRILLQPEAGEATQQTFEECCICLERKPELLLPCAHSYCLPCIEQWNVDHKTCPVCRETLSSTDDGWVVSEGPDCLEITTEIQKSLLSLTQ